jgi:CRP-like cAMP-binding protein
MRSPNLSSIKKLRPFSAMPDDVLAALTVESLECKRGTVLDMEQGKVYVLLEGAADEMTPSVGRRQAHVGFIRPGDSIGWYPIAGHVVHRKYAVYAVVSSPCDWSSWAWLAAQVEMVNRRLWDVRAQLAIIKTTTVAERLQVDPPGPKEPIVDVARRLGCTRENVYRVLRESAT